MLSEGFHRRFSATGALKALARPALDAARGVPVRARMWRMVGEGPLAVFLPAAGREGSALLRIHNVAGALGPLGWRCLVLPWRLSLAQRRRFLATLAPDVVVMQGARHPLNRPVLYRGLTIVYDMDDADFHLDHLAGPVRQAMPDVRLVTAGSAYIAQWCREAGAGEARVVWTGTPVSPRPRPPQALRPPVMAWAQTRPMTYVREAALVREAAARIAARRPGVILRLYDRRAGDDPGFAESFAAPGLTVEWCEKARYSDYLASFDDVALGVAPLCPETPFSRGKSFGKVLAYLDRKVPVIASDAGEHGGFFSAATGVVTNDLDRWSAAAAGLLDAADQRQAMADAAFLEFRARLTTDAAASRLDTLLRQAAGIADRAA